MIGEVVGNYRIASQIGTGGMGAVYEAHHELLGKSAAIKVLLPERSANREIVQRFFNEARAVSTVNHPGIPEIFDFGHLPSGNAYIIMELLTGETLGDRLKRERPMSIKAAVSIARHIAGVLGATHDHGIVHRDLKPDNVFLVADPALPRGERAKILDFGIAKLADNDRPSKVKTETGRLMGTPYYMSPEQCRGSGRVDHRSDIYSLGCVLYQMLTGRPPFVLEGSGEILAAHIHLAPLSPRTVADNIPSGVENIVMRLLAKDPDERFQTMDEVIHALNTAVPRGNGVESEPSLQASSAQMPAHIDDAAATHRDPSNPSIRDAKVQSPRRKRRSSSPPRGFSAPTTLGSSASESMSTYTGDPVARSSSWMMYAGLIAAAAAATFFIFRSILAEDESLASTDTSPIGATSSNSGNTGGTEPSTTEDGSPTVTQLSTVESAAAPQVAANTARPLVRPLAVEAKVALVVESNPAGAKVYRESDGVLLGVTPVTYSVNRGSGSAMFLVKKAGYRTETVSMGIDRDDAFMVDLKRARGNRRSNQGPSAKKRSSETGSSKDETDKTESSGKSGPGKDGAIDPFKFAPQ